MNLHGDRNQCPGCSEYFNSTAAFDKHRTGDHNKQTRRCLSPDEMTSKGMRKGADSFWRGEAMPESIINKRKENHELQAS